VFLWVDSFLKAGASLLPRSTSARQRGVKIAHWSCGNQTLFQTAINVTLLIVRQGLW